MNKELKEKYIADAQKWITIQRPIAEALKFEGCEIFEKDHTHVAFGCCLFYNCDQFEVEIDFGDARTLEDVSTFEVFVSEKNDKYPDDWTSGDLNSYEDVRKMCQLLKEGKKKEALGMFN